MTGLAKSFVIDGIIPFLQAPLEVTATRKKTMKPTKIATTLPPDEWDFREIREDWEVPYAILYEYSRSSTVRHHLQRWFNTRFAESGMTLASHPELLSKFKISRTKSLELPTSRIIDTIWDSGMGLSVIQSALALLAQEWSVEISMDIGMIASYTFDAVRSISRTANIRNGCFH